MPYVVTTRSPAARARRQQRGRRRGAAEEHGVERAERVESRGAVGGPGVGRLDQAVELGRDERDVPPLAARGARDERREPAGGEGLARGRDREAPPRGVGPRDDLHPRDVRRGQREEPVPRAAQALVRRGARRAQGVGTEQHLPGRARRARRAQHERGARGHVRVRRRGHRAGVVHRVARDRQQIHGADLERALRVQARQHEQILHQQAHPPRLVLDARVHLGERVAPIHVARIEHRDQRHVHVHGGGLYVQERRIQARKSLHPEDTPASQRLADVAPSSHPSSGERNGFVDVVLDVDGDRDGHALTPRPQPFGNLSSTISGQ